MSANASTKLDKSQQEMWRNIFAASSTTSFCVAAMNPIDVLRIKWQTQPFNASSLSMSQFMSSQIKQCQTTREFFTKLYLPGIGVNAMSVGTSSGLRLGLYPVTKEVVCTLAGSIEANSAIMFSSGFLSGALGFFLATPFFTAKIQAQSYYATKSGMGYLVDTCRQTNPFRGSSILVARGALFSAGFSLGYDGTKTRMRNSGVTEGPMVHAFASVVAALVATGLAAPFDSVLTRFQTSRSSSSVLECIQGIYSEAGPRGLFRGWSLFFARVAPLFVVQLPLYEQVRSMLGMGFM